MVSQHGELQKTVQGDPGNAFRSLFRFLQQLSPVIAIIRYEIQGRKEENRSYNSRRDLEMEAMKHSVCQAASSYACYFSGS